MRVGSESFAESDERGDAPQIGVSLGVRREKFLFFKNIVCFFIVFHVDNCDIADGFRRMFGVL